MSQLSLNASVAQKIEVAPGLIILRVVPDGWDLPDLEGEGLQEYSRKAPGQIHLERYW